MSALMLMSANNTMELGRDCLMLELAMRQPVHLGLLVSACEPFKPYFIKEDLAAGLARDYA